jgi:hypothetical protein
MNNMCKPEAKHLAGLHYARELWLSVEEANDNEDEDAEWVSFEEVIERAITAARKDAKEKAQ